MCHAAQGIVLGRGAWGKWGAWRGVIPVASTCSQLGFAHVGTPMPRLPLQLAQGDFGDCFGWGEQGTGRFVCGCMG